MPLIINQLQLKIGHLLHGNLETLWSSGEKTGKPTTNYSNNLVESLLMK